MYDLRLGEEIAWLTYLHAYSQGKSIRDVLAGTEERLRQLCAPLDVPPQDAAGIGEADHEHDGEPDG